MTELSVAHRAALAQLVENVPDRVLTQLGLAVAGMPGQKARALEDMLIQAGIDRARRARGFSALIPMFRPRPDGIATTTFPAAVLPRLWKLASSRASELLAYLDPCEDEEDDAYRVSAVCVRLYAAAAAGVRDQPEAVWPTSLGAPAEREAGLAALAHVCDLAGLAHRGLPSLPAWIDRPTGDQKAELRLLIRDAGAVSEDGALELLEILFSHIEKAPLILRLVANSSQVAGRESFLQGSELAVFIDLLLAGAETRLERIKAFKPGVPIETIQDDLAWIACLSKELEGALEFQGDSDWSNRLRKIKAGAAARLSDVMNKAEKLVDVVMPMAKVQTAGRMGREMPALTVAIDAPARAAAAASLDLIRAIRSLATPFGCEGQRHGVVQALTLQLSTYADLAFEEINTGAIADEPLAIERTMMAADFLDRIEAETEARTVRRRAAVAGGESRAA